MHPIIMVANFSGNVGKTTLTRNLLAANIPGLQIYAVEDVNAGYNQGEAVQLSAEQTQTILEQAIEASFTGPVVVDVGASNVSNFFAALSCYDNMHEFIARVIVPTEPSDKVQTDTLSTLHYLIEKLGFDSSKITLVLNKAPTRIPSQEVFGETVMKAAELGVFVAGEIPESDTFQMASSLGLSISELAKMEPRTLLLESHKNASESADRQQRVRLMLAASSSRKLKEALDEVFCALDITA